MGRDGFAALKRAEHAVALLDIGLPENVGLRCPKGVRGKPGQGRPSSSSRHGIGVEDMVPVLISAPTTTSSSRSNFGALLARIRAVMRRANDRPISLMTSKEITLDPSTYVGDFPRHSACAFRPRILGAVCIDGASGNDSLALPDRKPDLRLGRGGPKQCRRRASSTACARNTARTSCGTSGAQAGWSPKAGI